jgi:hypothetical protein
LVAADLERPGQNPVASECSLVDHRAVMAKKKSKDHRIEIYFVRGKMKKRKIPLIDGMEVDEFIRRNADDQFLIQEGHFEILHEREQARNRQNPVKRA